MQGHFYFAASSAIIKKLVQEVIGAGQFLKSFRGLGILGIQVGVMLFSQIFKGAF
jgi:hypothetical protein